jgi:hypothetical protein
MDSPNTLFATDPDALILKTEKLVILQTFRTFSLYSLNTNHTEKCFKWRFQRIKEVIVYIITMGTGSFLGVKWPRRGVDHLPHLAPRLSKESPPPPPSGPSWPILEWTLPLFTLQFTSLWSGISIQAWTGH